VSSIPPQLRNVDSIKTNCLASSRFPSSERASGTTDGEGDGEAVGDAIGEAVGETVGDGETTGVAVGVGVSVGVAVGTALGNALGNGEGIGDGLVGAPTQPKKTNAKTKTLATLNTTATLERVLLFLFLNDSNDNSTTFE